MNIKEGKKRKRILRVTKFKKKNENGNNKKHYVLIKIIKKKILNW